MQGCVSVGAEDVRVISWRVSSRVKFKRGLIGSSWWCEIAKIRPIRFGFMTNTCFYVTAILSAPGSCNVLFLCWYFSFLHRSTNDNTMTSHASRWLQNRTLTSSISPFPYLHRVRDWLMHSVWRKCLLNWDMTIFLPSLYLLLHRANENVKESAIIKSIDFFLIHPLPNSRTSWYDEIDLTNTRGNNQKITLTTDDACPKFKMISETI